MTDPSRTLKFFSFTMIQFCAAIYNAKRKFTLDSHLMRAALHGKRVCHIYTVAKTALIIEDAILIENRNFDSTILHEYSKEDTREMCL